MSAGSPDAPAGAAAPPHDAAPLRADALRLVHAALDAIGEYLYVDRLDGSGAWRSVFASGLVEGFLGHPVADDRVADVWADRVHPDDRAAFDAFAAAARAGSGVAELEYRLVGDGGDRWVRERRLAQPTLDGSLTSVGLVRDVTREHALRERLAGALAEAEAARGDATEARLALRRAVEAAEVYVFTIEVSPDGAWRTVLDTNWAPMIGRPALPDDLAERDALWAEHIHPDDRPVVEHAVREIARGREIAYTFRLRGVDGLTRWVEARERPRERRADGTIVADGIAQDITGRLAYEDEMRLARAAAAERAVSDPLTGVAHRRALVEHLARLAGEDPDARLAVLLVDIDSFRRVNDRFGHHVGDEVLIEVARRVREASGPGAFVARIAGEEFCVLEAAPADDAALRARAEAVRAAVRAAPVAAGDDLRLEITVCVGAAASVVGERPDILLDAAERALAHAHRAGRDRTALASDEAALDDLPIDAESMRIALALARTAGLREGLADDHCIAAADLAARIARGLALPGDVVARCVLGAFLHDVGKVRVPDRVLQKAGPLDEDEWVLMRQHAEAGAALVAAMPGLEEATDAVRHHHERWDGTGYPAGLAGTAIPIEARVLAVADAVVAMREERVYRPALPPARVMAELRAGAGSQFDAAVVEAAVAVIGEPEA